MFRYIATILVGILLSAPLVAEITPFPASFHTQMVPTNGTSLYVRVGGNGPAVVLLHVFGFTGDMWAPLAIVLAKDHTVIVPDLRGMGMSDHAEVADGRVWLRPSGPSCFAGDLPEEEQKLVWATHYAPAADLFHKNAPGVAWKSKPSWYVLANNDQTVHPELQRFVAKRMGATTVEVNSSHVPMLSQPELVLDVIRKAIKTVEESVTRS